MSWLSFDLDLAREIARAHHRDMVRAAALSRALSETRGYRPGLIDRGLERVADALIAVGSKLKRRHQRHAAHAQRYASAAR